MTAVLERLKPLIGEVPGRPQKGETLTWEFGQDFLEKGTAYFIPLLRINPVLIIEYSVHCNRLVEDFQAKADKEEFTSQLTEQLIDALVMAELLTHIFQYYLCVPREVRRLKKEQEIFRQLLRERGFDFQEKIWPEIDTSTVAQDLRNKTAIWNWPRLFSGRLRRVVKTSELVLKIKRYSAFVTIVDKYVGPTLSYFSWVFYIPRLVVSTLLLLKHVLPFWLEGEEKNLGWWLRLMLQIQRRWFLLGNDGVWLVAGLLNCFILIGALSAASMYMTIALFAFDFAMAGLRAFIELGRLYTIQGEYVALLNAATSKEEYDEILGYLNHLNKRIAFEEMRLLLSVFTTGSLFLFMLSALPPLVAINPLIPFIGAVIIVFITAMAYAAEKWLEKKRPKDRILELEPLREPVFAAKSVEVIALEQLLVPELESELVSELESEPLPETEPEAELLFRTNFQPEVPIQRVQNQRSTNPNGFFSCAPEASPLMHTSAPSIY